MLHSSIQMVCLCLLLLTVQLFCWGCAAQKPIAEVMEPVEENICGVDMSGRVAQLETGDVGSFLERAEEEGGVACWGEAVQAALMQGRSVPREHLVKALDIFNRNVTVDDFHLAVGQYLRGLADDSRSYAEEDRQLLEAYSRYVIRTARSQDDENLKLAQMACARLDRALYERLFE